MKYLLIDTLNLFFRAMHSAKRHTDIETKVAFAIHVTLSSVAKCWREQKADHVIFCLDGHSWRKGFYAPYKKNREVARQAKSEEEQIEGKMFFEALEELQSFLILKSNCTVLHHSMLEADDLIAGFIQLHPDDEHIIISTDSDFHQLLSKNVKQYDGVADELHTLDGIFNYKGKLVVDKKTKEPKKIPDPSWILFEKCIRGDSGDNVFSAYPGVRTKGSKNKVGLTEAYNDRSQKGFAWNNLMLQRWTDHNNVEHRVIDDYNRNVTLIDLTAQPDHIRTIINDTIALNSVQKQVPQIGTMFLKFCGKYALVRITDSLQSYVDYLTRAYPK